MSGRDNRRASSPLALSEMVSSTRNSFGNIVSLPFFSALMIIGHLLLVQEMADPVIGFWRYNIVMGDRWLQLFVG